MCVQYNRADSGQGLLSFGAAREFFLPSPPVKLIKMNKNTPSRVRGKKKAEKRIIVEIKVCICSGLFLLWPLWDVIPHKRCVVGEWAAILDKSSEESPVSGKILIVRGGHRKVLVSEHECGAVVSSLSSPLLSSRRTPGTHVPSLAHSQINACWLLAACFDFGMFQLNDAAWAWN